MKMEHLFLWLRSFSEENTYVAIDKIAYMANPCRVEFIILGNNTYML